MKKQTQYGKGLSGFLFGLLLATAVIGGVLFFLNKGKQNSFKDLSQPKQTSHTEVLQPKSEPSPSAPESVPDKSGTNTDVVNELIEKEMAASDAKLPKPVVEEKPTEPDNLPDKDESKTSVAPVAPSRKDVEHQHPKETSVKSHSKKEVIKTDQDKTVVEAKTDSKVDSEKSLAEKKAELLKKKADKAKGQAADKKSVNQLTEKQKTRVERQLAEKKALEKKKEESRKAVKPTPEQILNSGSLEKARIESQKATKESVKAKQAIDSSKENKTANAKEASKAKVVLQMGSYADRNSADAQRAKLAMVGIQSNVVETKANGKTVYRVQSGALAQDAANRVQQTLKKNGMSSFSRLAQ